jgi:phosphate butyryltransferase
MMQSMQDIVRAAKAAPTKTLVIACAADQPVLEAVEQARKEDIVQPILVGDQDAIVALLQTLGYDPSLYEIHHQPDDVAACVHSVRLVHDHPGYFLMKGLVSTSTILKAALDKEHGLRTANRISHVSVMQVPTYHKLLMMTDGAMNIAPDLEDKRQIVENAAHIAHALGIPNPAVGVIAAVETVNPKMEATLHAAELKQMNLDGRLSGCVVGGPFALDNAIDKEAAHHKGITDPIAGEIDILLMPRIEAGNVFYKTMMFLANATSASVIAGASRPIVLTSRADSMETKFHSIALAALVVES